MIFQSTTKSTKKNILFGEGFCHFFISVLHFWIKQYTNFLKLTKFVSHHIVATQATFTATNFSPRKLFFDTACFELFGGGHGHLATLTDPIRSALARSRQGFICKSGKKKK
jgi:hypothetical protein